MRITKSTGMFPRYTIDCSRVELLLLRNAIALKAGLRSSLPSLLRQTLNALGKALA